jgi:hypothetical protein
MEASYGRLQGSEAIKEDLQTLADNVEYKPLPGEISSAFKLVEPSSDDEHRITGPINIRYKMGKGDVVQQIDNNVNLGIEDNYEEQQKERKKDKRLHRRNARKKRSKSQGRD